MTDRLTIRLNHDDVANMVAIGDALNATAHSTFMDKAHAVRTGLKAAATLARDGGLHQVLAAAKAR